MTDKRNQHNDPRVPKPSRRNVLQAGAAASVTFLAGCSGGDDEPSGGAGEPVGTQTIDTGELSNFTDVIRDVAEQWSQIGVNFELETSTWGTFVGRVYTESDFEHAAHTPWGSSPDRVDPDFHLSTYTSDSGVNISGYENEEYDELFSQQRAAYDPEERSSIIQEMQQILREDLPELVFIWPKASLPVNSGSWNIEPTEFIGARTTGTMTVLTAEPTGDTSTLVVGAQQEIAAPNPLAPDSNDLQYLFKLAYDTPLRVGLDGNPTEWAVENVENIDETTLDMTLREGMEFHDGEPVTVEDLEFTFNFLGEYDFPKFDPFLSDVEGVEVQTDRTLRVNLAQPNVAFLNSSMTFMNILPEHIWSDVPDQVDQPVNWDADVEDLVGSGPLQLTEITDTEIRYETFDDHFQPPEYDEFIFVNRASMEAIRADFEQENIHMTTSSPPPSVTNALADENDFISKSSAASVLQMKISYLLDQAPFSDPAFRKALMHATNPERISQIHYNGEAQIGDGTLLHPQSPFGADLEPISQDIEAAKDVLREAGYTYDSDGQLYYPEE